MLQDKTNDAMAEVLRQDSGLIQIMDSALVDATIRAGRHLACRPGCTQCCHGAFAISPLDALRLRTTMSEMAAAEPAKAAAIAARAERYLEEKAEVEKFFEPKKTGDRE